MGQTAAEMRTTPTDSQPGRAKSDGLLASLRMKVSVSDVAAAPAHASLRGATLVLTRAAGSARHEAQRVRALGGRALLLPGSRLAPAADASAARAALHAALRAPLVRRSFRLGQEYDRGEISASLKQGVLTLRIPRVREAQPRQIPVQAG